MFRRIASALSAMIVGISTIFTYTQPASSQAMAPIVARFLPVRPVPMQIAPAARINPIEPFGLPNWKVPGGLRVLKFAFVNDPEYDSHVETYEECLRSSTALSSECHLDNPNFLAAKKAFTTSNGSAIDAAAQAQGTTSNDATSRAVRTSLASSSASAIDSKDIRELCDETASDSVRDAASARVSKGLEQRIRAVPKQVGREDIVQNAMLSILMKCQEIVSKNNPAAYVFVVLKSRKMDYFRKELPSLSFDEKGGEARISSSSLMPLTAKPAEDYEALDLLSNLETQLSSRQWQVLQGYLNKEKTGEIASRLNIKSDTVRDHREAIREMFCRLSSTDNDARSRSASGPLPWMR
jgi:DNA-directed RNA polymerase specialized sigma24 family protein